MTAAAVFILGLRATSFLCIFLVFSALLVRILRSHKSMVKLKLSHYTPWRRLGGGIAPTHF
jgi:hypothetical protein